MIWVTKLHIFNKKIYLGSTSSSSSIMEMSPLTNSGGDSVAYNKQENSIGTVSTANFNSSK